MRQKLRGCGAFVLRTFIDKYDNYSIIYITNYDP